MVEGGASKESHAACLTDAVLHRSPVQSLNLTFWAMLLISLSIVLLALLVPPVEIRQAVEMPAE
jgi:hypothetical protein